MIQCVCVDLHQIFNYPVSKIELVHARKLDRILVSRVAKSDFDDATWRLSADRMFSEVTGEQQNVSHLTPNWVAGATVPGKRLIVAVH
jgi:hypothetical protein